MKNFFNSLKSMLGGDQDPRMSAIKKAMHSLGYDCKVSDDKKYASCEFPADNNLRYKSEVSLRLTEEDIDLTYTIYAKRIRHDAPFQDPKSKAALKGYHYQSGCDELYIWKHLPQDTTKSKDIAEAIRQIRATALAVYTDADNLKTQTRPLTSTAYRPRPSRTSYDYTNASRKFTSRRSVYLAR